MLVRRLYVQNFRNLAEQELHFSPEINILVGENGHGKTNLVEAIYILSTTKSFRTSKKEELIRWGKDSAVVFGEVERDDSVATLSLEITKTKTRFLRNDEEVKRDLSTLTTVSFFPSDLEIIKGSPCERRRFLDKLIVDLYPESLNLFLTYQRALAQKNRILKSVKVDIEAVHVYNKILTEVGEKISEYRESVSTLLTDFATKELFFLKTPEKSLVVEYKPSVFEPDKAEREVAAKMSLFGAHRDDLSFILDGNDARAYASQGQTRSVLLALKLASIKLIEEKRKTSPIVLLDDVDSELDDRRRTDFFNHLSESKRQIFITSPSGRHLEGLPGRIFKIKDGHWIKP